MLAIDCDGRAIETAVVEMTTRDSDRRHEALWQAACYAVPASDGDDDSDVRGP
jgi:hypothetical protein